MASVGVCTRPIELLDEPETMARARLAFMPTSQSAFARLSAAAYRLLYSEPSFSSSSPFRMASSVSEEIHRRLNGFVQPRKSYIQRKISSPSRPASVATMMLSERLNTFSMIFSCFEAAMSVTIPLSVRTCLETRRNGSGSIGRSSDAVFV